jgi:hypothetical protein
MTDSYKILAQDVAFKSRADSAETSIASEQKFVSTSYDSANSAYSTDGVTWTASTMPATASWSSVVYGNGKFVAFRDYGDGAHSTDGITWTEFSTSYPAEPWASAIYADGKFVAVSNSASSIYVSTDGARWDQNSLTTFSNWSSIAYGSGSFVVASGNAAVQSTDAITWTEIPDVITGGYNQTHLAYGLGKFVAVFENNSGTDNSAYSTDGVTWTASTMPSSAAWSSIAYANGKFVAISSYGGSAYSTNGVSWTQSNMPSTIYNGWSLPLVYGRGVFVTFEASYTSDSSRALYSTDGISWTITVVPPSRWTSLAYGEIVEIVADSQANILYTVPENTQAAISSISLINSSDTDEDYYLGVVKAEDVSSSVIITEADRKFVAIPYDTSSAAYSTDGITWTETALPSDSFWHSVTYGNGKFVAVEGSSAASSTDGIAWTQSSIPDGDWQSATYGNGKFVTVSGYNNAGSAYSTDGIAWTVNTMPELPGWAGRWSVVAYGDGKFLTIGSSFSFETYTYPSYLAYSTDGIAWTQSSIPDGDWFQLTYGNGKFVAFSRDMLAYSTDGITWTVNTMPGNGSWQSATFGDGKFLAIRNGSAASSTDAIAWTQSSMPDGYGDSVTYGNGKFVSPGYFNSKSAYSTDGINWTESSMTLSQRWSSVTYGELSPETQKIFLSNKQTIIPTRSIAPNAVDEISGGITLSTGDQIRVFSYSPDLIVQVYGVEIA